MTVHLVAAGVSVARRSRTLGEVSVTTDRHTFAGVWVTCDGLTRFNVSASAALTIAPLRRSGVTLGSARRTLMRSLWQPGVGVSVAWSEVSVTPHRTPPAV